MDGVIDVFVNNDIALQFENKAAQVDATLLANLLEKEQVKVEKIAPTTQYLN